MIEIRTLKKEAPWEDLIALSRAFFSEYQSHHPDFFKIGQLHDQAIVEYFSHWLDNEEGETFIALLDGQIVGYLTAYLQTQADYWRIKRVGHISGLMIHPACRRQGIASRLLEQACLFFQAHHVSYFTVFTAVNNHQAVEFYRRSGLEPLTATYLGEIAA